MRIIRTFITLLLVHTAACAFAPQEQNISSVGYEDYLYYETFDWKDWRVRLNLYEDRLLVRKSISGSSRTESGVSWCTAAIAPGQFARISATLRHIQVFSWNSNYSADALDGFGWEMQASLGDDYYEGEGSNAKPDELDSLEAELASLLNESGCESFRAGLLSYPARSMQ